MIHECLRAWKECPNLFLWNVGALSVLGILTSVFAECLIEYLMPTRYELSFGPVVAAQPTSAQLLGDALHSQPFRFVQMGFAICGLVLMVVAVARSIYRRLMVSSRGA
jgi:hypothetical protein